MRTEADVTPMVPKTVRFPSDMVAEIERLLALPGNEELDFAGWVRQASRNEIRTAKAERAACADVLGDELDPQPERGGVIEPFPQISPLADA
jgi:hypothetical protein